MSLKQIISGHNKILGSMKHWWGELPPNAPVATGLHLGNCGCIILRKNTFQKFFFLFLQRILMLFDRNDFNVHILAEPNSPHWKLISGSCNGWNYGRTHLHSYASAEQSTLLHFYCRFDRGRTVHIPTPVFDVAILLSHANSTVNFFLYSWRLNDFRKELHRLVLKRFQKS